MKSLKYSKIVIIKYYTHIIFQAVGWVCNKKNLPLRLMNDLNIIDNLMTQVDIIEMIHIFRETNSLANFLSKNGVSREDPIDFGYGLISFFILFSLLEKEFDLNIIFYQ